MSDERDPFGIPKETIKAHDEHDLAWSRKVAGLAVDGLLVAKLIGHDGFDRAVEIVAEEIHVRLCANDRPRAGRDSIIRAALLRAYSRISPLI